MNKDFSIPVQPKMSGKFVVFSISGSYSHGFNPCCKTFSFTGLLFNDFKMKLF